MARDEYVGGVGAMKRFGVTLGVERQVLIFGQTSDDSLVQRPSERHDP